jgi:predicted ATP-dependent serine protease
MAAVFQAVEITWGGEVYRVKPTMRILNEIEQLSPLSKIARRILDGEPPKSHIAVAVAILLRSAGVQVSDEDVYAELVTGDSSFVADVGIALIRAAYPSTGKPEGDQESKG